MFQQLRYFVLAHKDQISNEQSLNQDLGQGYNKSKKMAFHFSAGRSCEKPISAFQKKNTFLVQVADVIVISLGETLQRHQKTASDLPLPTIEKKRAVSVSVFGPLSYVGQTGPPPTLLTCCNFIGIL